MQKYMWFFFLVNVCANQSWCMDPQDLLILDDALNYNSMLLENLSDNEVQGNYEASAAPVKKRKAALPIAVYAPNPIMKEEPGQLYLVRIDNQQNRLLKFWATNSQELIRQYIIYLVSDRTGSVPLKLHETVRRTIPHEHIVIPEDGLYSFNCNYKNCVLLKVDTSLDALIAIYIAHRWTKHRNDEEWYKGVEAGVAESYEAAVRKLQGI